MRFPFRPGDGDDPIREARRRALIRGMGKGAIVVVAAVAGGTLLGVGLSKLNGADKSSLPAPVAASATPTSAANGATTTTASTSTPTVPTATTTVTATTAAPLGRAPQQTTGGKLNVDILTTVVHPVSGDPSQRATVTVHARITNGSARVVNPEPPVLLVGATQLQLAPGPGATPLLGALGQGAIADGKLSFVTTGAVTGQLTTGRVRIQIAGKQILITPQIGSATSG
jgi:hypothetical protein